MIEHVYKEAYALLFGIIILYFAANPAIHFNLEAGIFNYLGKISYGLYMYHSIAIALTIGAAVLLKVASNSIIYPFSLGLTVPLAGLSCKYFESIFLRFKLNYSTIRVAMIFHPTRRNL